MDETQVLKELAEEIRINSGLRRRLGMVEGSTSGVSGDVEDEIILETADGDTFAVSVESV